MVTNGISEPLKGVGVRLAAGEGLCDAEALGSGEELGETEGDALGDTEGEELGEAEGEAEGLALGDADGLALGDGDALALGEGLGWASRFSTTTKFNKRITGNIHLNSENFNSDM